MNSESLPFISIVIPTYNRPKQLKACLHSLARLDYPRDRFEVIVVDDGSPHPLGEVVALFEKQLDLHLKRQTNSGPGPARNTGVAHARGEFVFFTDDDCAPARNCLQKLARQFAKTPFLLVGGHTVNALPHNAYATASQLIVDYIYNYYTRKGEGLFFTSNNMAFPRAAFLEVGGFCEKYHLAASEDREICRRWILSGREMAYTPEVVIFHSHAMTLRTFWRQHFTYGRGAWDFHQVDTNIPPSKMEPPSFYLNMMLYPMKRGRGSRAPYQCFLMGLSQLAIAVGFFYQKRFSTEAAAKLGHISP
ncbi:putative mycofactocin biosynthesis glycosyltransferase MftF [Abditibacteriota bacterium]|nr:putative mycofactocin biosynthesis glycosyltransferase MftF [Abditibacteriota bacterium]